jgi:phosphoribosylformylglycinamidine (FGAM) synthase PurS component
MKYKVFFEFVIEADDIEIAEAEAKDIAETNFDDTRVNDLLISVRGTDD